MTTSQIAPIDHHLQRRKLIQVGAAGLFGLSLPGFLWARNQRNPGAERRGAGQARGAKSYIFVVVSGGLSHIDTLDPKPQAPAEIRGPYKPIATAVPGVQLSEMLPKLAALADRYTLIRSLSHGDGVHVTAAHTMLTGGADGSRRDQTPFMGSLISRLRPSTASIPGYVWLHNMKTGANKIPRYENGLNVLGHQFAPLRIGHELDNPASPEFHVGAFDPAEGVTRRRVARRFELLNSLEGGQDTLLRSAAGEQFATYQQKARDLVAGAAARRAFDLSGEPAKLRDRYGRHPLGQYTLMARRLIEAGVRLVTLTAWPGLAPGETTPTVTQVWDTHDIRYGKRGDNMFGNGPFGLKWSLPRLDQSLSALLEDLDQRGLLDETLVVVLSEFGRTPKFEGKGRGRGHWPHVYTGLMAGAGVRRGAVYGASDKQGAYVASQRRISHADFGATLFQALGIAPETRWGPDGFSFRVNNGVPVREIFG